jgi:hypothetical protein
LELAQDGDFDSALLELRRAYDLAPTYRLLYNIGLVYQQLKEHARAYDTFERYLSEGGSEIPAERREEITRRMERLKTRIGYLSITTVPTGAEVFVDDLNVGRSPLEGPRRVNSGQRKVSVRLPGHPSESRVVELAGGEVKSVTFDLRPPSLPPAPPPRSAGPWIAWGVTGALAAGTAVTGILALNAANSYDSTASLRPGQDMGTSWEKVHTLSLASDILLGATVVAAGIATYVTIRSSKSTKGNEAAVWIAPPAIGGRF